MSSLADTRKLVRLLHEHILARHESLAVLEKKLELAPAADLRDAIEDALSELLFIERAKDLVERSLDPHPERCTHFTAGSACRGAPRVRYCEQCLATFRRCEGHGGYRWLNSDMKAHKSLEHSSSGGGAK